MALLTKWICTGGIHKTSTKGHFTKIGNCKPTYQIHNSENSNLGKVRLQRKMFQTKDQNKSPEKIYEVKIGNLPDKAFKVMIIKMFREFRRLDEKT